MNPADPSIHPPAPVLVAGAWRASHGRATFCAVNPKTRETLPDAYPVSDWQDIDAALEAADAAAAALRAMPDVEQRIGAFLENYAAGIEARADTLVAAAHAETALPVSPRLKDGELPRTTGQLRQAAVAARDGTWLCPTIDTKAGLRSCLAPVGPVWVVGPNNFPFAFNGISGGDFASAIAAGNPVIAKAHPLHPTTSRLLAQAAHEAAVAAGLPPGTVQMLYHMEADDGLKLTGDPRLKAVAFTGSRRGGLRLKETADRHGKLFFGEMSSINPVVLLPGAISDNAADIAQQFVASLLMGTGQFCTSPGLLLVLAGDATESFIGQVVAKLQAAPAGTLFSEAGQTSLLESVGFLVEAGASVLTGGVRGASGGFCVENTFLRVDGGRFLKNPAALQGEAFGNASMVVVADSVNQMREVIEALEGNLTGTIYSSTGGTDDAAYALLEPSLRSRVGRLLNDKMPTGVAVSPAMNHGGPFPATSQPHFTAVGMPAAIARFTQLQCYDNVRPGRLPPCLANKNPTGRMWRLIDGNPTQADV